MRSFLFGLLPAALLILVGCTSETTAEDEAPRLAEDASGAYEAAPASYAGNEEPVNYGLIPFDATKTTPLQVGDVVPDAPLKAPDGDSISLHRAIGNQPTALVFYRGSWCPYCTRHLAELRQVKDELDALGYELLALSMDKPEAIDEMIRGKSLDYAILSDANAHAAYRFGVAFRMPQDDVDAYKADYDIDLEAASGKDHHVLPVPAVFLIDADKTVRYVYTNPDYKTRLSGEELLEAARESQPAGI
jgi:peroxiredoxin